MATTEKRVRAEAEGQAVSEPSEKHTELLEAIKGSVFVAVDDASAVALRAARNRSARDARSGRIPPNFGAR